MCQLLRPQTQAPDFLSVITKAVTSVSLNEGLPDMQTALSCRNLYPMPVSDAVKRENAVVSLGKGGEAGPGTDPFLTA